MSGDPRAGAKTRMLVIVVLLTLGLLFIFGVL
jgi:hypothetical protein